MSGKFEITRSHNGKFMFNLKAENGQVILTSQMYEAKVNATQGIDSVRLNALHDERFDRKVATNGSPFFNLKAANGQVIGHGQMYSSDSAMETGIASVKKNAPEAIALDLTHG